MSTCIKTVFSSSSLLSYLSTLSPRPCLHCHLDLVYTVTSALSTLSPRPCLHGHLGLVYTVTSTLSSLVLPPCHTGFSALPQLNVGIAKLNIVNEISVLFSLVGFSVLYSDVLSCQLDLSCCQTTD